MPEQIRQDLTRVEQLMKQAIDAPQDADARRRFTQALLDSTVLVPGKDEEDGFAPLAVDGPDGHPAIAFFTSAAPMQLALSQLGITQTRVAELPCREFWQTSVAHNTATSLNPLSPMWKPYPAAEMSDELQGIPQEQVTRTMQPGDTYQVTALDPAPPRVVRALTRHLDALDGISSATLAWMTHPDGLQGYLLLVVTDLPDEQVTSGIDGVLEQLDGNTLDVMIEPTDDPVDRTPGIAPFYPAS